jgi:hypothetical protein
LLGKIAEFSVNDGCERSRLETQETTVCLSTIRQVTYAGRRFLGRC